MDDIEVARRVLYEWDAVKSKMSDCQELYDMLGEALFFIKRYSEKNNLALPNRDAITRMVDRIQSQVEKVNAPMPQAHQTNLDSLFTKRGFDRTSIMVLYHMRRMP